MTITSRSSVLAHGLLATALMVLPAIASAQTTALTANMRISPAIVPGTTGVPIATVTFSAPQSGTNFSVKSIPLSVTYGGNLNAGHFLNCRWTNGGSTVSVTDTAGLPAGTNVVMFGQAASVPGASSVPTTLVLTCDISNAAPLGGTAIVAMNTSDIQVSDSTTGAAVIPQAGVSGQTSGIVTVATADTTSTTGSTSGTTGSGTGVLPPNTGAGANTAANLAVLLVALLAALGAGAYIARSRRID